MGDVEMDPVGMGQAGMGSWGNDGQLGWAAAVAECAPDRRRMRERKQCHSLIGDPGHEFPELRKGGRHPALVRSPAWLAPEVMRLCIAAWVAERG